MIADAIIVQEAVNALRHDYRGHRGRKSSGLRVSLKKLDQHCDHVLVHTGQNYDYELNGVFFEELSIATQARSFRKLLAKTADH
jgi:hypothetical protein